MHMSKYAFKDVSLILYCMLETFVRYKNICAMNTQGKKILS